MPNPTAGTAAMPRGAEGDAPSATAGPPSSSRRATATRCALAAGLVLSGLVAGTFFATQLGQVQLQDTLDARDFTLVKHGFEVAMGTVMPPLVILTVVAHLALLVLLWDVRSTRFRLVAGCALAWIGAVVVTLVFNVPVNALAATWDAATPPANWAELRDQWHTGQAVRTVLSVPAFALLAVAATVPARPAARRPD